MRQRIADTLLEIMQKEDHKVVLAVSHGGACRGFMRYWQETSQVDQKGGLKNCCILKFEFEDNEFRLLEIINHNLMKRKVKTFRFLLDLKFTQGSIIKIGNVEL